MKLVLFFSPDANQRALAHKLAQEVPIEAIVAWKPRLPATPGISARLARIARGLVGLPLRKAWFGMLARYDRRFPHFPVEPILEVDDINDPAVLELVHSLRPELVLVSGTNLLKQPLISAISEHGRVVNLHTGISPYMRGGPNCTNWCLATDQFELIGNTIMWIDAGIDSGNLIATEQTPLDRSESLTQLHVKVMDHAHDLTVRAIKRLLAGKKVPAVPQQKLGRGSLFLSKHWDARTAARAVSNFYRRYRRGTWPDPPELVSLD